MKTLFVSSCQGLQAEAAAAPGMAAMGGQYAGLMMQQQDVPEADRMDAG